MRDLDLLNTFTEQSAHMFKPAKLDAGPINSYSFDTDRSMPARQVFSNTIVAEPEAPVGNLDFETFAVAEPVEDDVAVDNVVEELPKESETSDENEVEDKTSTKQKLSFYNHQGDVPPGFRAASSCTNCVFFIWWEYEHEHFCNKYDFPCTPNYTCDDFKSKRQAEEEDYKKEIERAKEQLLLSEQQETEVEAVVEAEDQQKELYTDEVQELIEEYKEVIQKFSDGALAGEVLTLTKSRFNKRSIFADAFLDMHYRNEYKRQNGTLDGAFTEG